MAPVTDVPSEVRLGKEAATCVTDGLIKMGGGIALGSVFSILFFKRRRWPIIMGTGFGIGLAWTNCTKALNVLTAPRSSKKSTKTE